MFHDASSTFLRNRVMWENITNPNVPEQLHKAGDGSDTVFPLRVISTKALDSKTHYSIQFCDVLAGLAAKHFSVKQPGADRDFLDSLIEVGLSSLMYNGIRPELEFPDRIPPRRLNGPDVVDQLGEIIRGSQSRRAPS